MLFVDPDAPSRTDNKFSEWRHWLVYDIQGSDVSTGSTLCQYIGAGPPEGTGLHRYIFLGKRTNIMLAAIVKSGTSLFIKDTIGPTLPVLNTEVSSFQRCFCIGLYQLEHY